MSSEFERESSVMCRADYPELTDDADVESGIFFAAEAGPLPPLKDKSPRPRSMRDVIGESPSMHDVYRMVDRVAPTLCTVLITGESGTGKELVARAVHDFSARGGKPFVAVNCGAIPESLIESELFGHIRGAFTGAHTNSIGKIGAAQGGTLFLDEIGELPPSVQVKLLRVLQSHEYSPVGDPRTHKADVRIVAATNIDFEEAVAQGTFREDLYYRLNVMHLMMPSLKERTSDIPLLVRHFLGTLGKRVGRDGVEIAPAAQELLMSWSWPGNVRELENTIERAMLLCQDNVIEPADLPARICGLRGEPRMAAELPDGGMDLRAAVSAFENNLIRQALERTGWNKNQAARLLGLNRTTLVEMLKRKRLALPRAA